MGVGRDVMQGLSEKIEQYIGKEIGRQKDDEDGEQRPNEAAAQLIQMAGERHGPVVIDHVLVVPSGACFLFRRVRRLGRGGRGRR